MFTALRVVAVDIGLVNLAICDVDVESPTVVRFRGAHLVDITEFVCKPGCKLGHDRTACDWVSHLTARFSEMLDAADVVLIERQPPMGFRSVEQLLFREYRGKARLVSPNSLHALFKVGGLDYDNRKEMMVRHARRIFGSSTTAAEQLSLPRSHDIADALLMTVWYAGTPAASARLRALRPVCPIFRRAEDHMEQFSLKRTWRQSSQQNELVVESAK